MKEKKHLDLPFSCSISLIKVVHEIVNLDLSSIFGSYTRVL